MRQKISTGKQEKRLKQIEQQQQHQQQKVLCYS